MPKDNYYAKEILELISNNEYKYIDNKYIISKKKHATINTNKFNDTIVINLYYLMDYFIKNFDKYNFNKVIKYLLEIDGNIDNYREFNKIIDHVPYYYLNYITSKIEKNVINNKKIELLSIIKSEKNIYLIELPEEIIKYIIDFVFKDIEINIDKNKITYINKNKITYIK